MFGYFPGRYESCHLEWCISSHSYAWWLNCSTRCRHTKSWGIWKSLWSSRERPKTKVYWVSLCNDFALKAKRCDGVNTAATLGSTVYIVWSTCRVLITAFALPVWPELLSIKGFKVRKAFSRMPLQFTVIPTHYVIICDGERPCLSELDAVFSRSTPSLHLDLLICYQF